MGLVRQGEEARGLAVALRLRVDEGDREGRQAEGQPHLMCPIPQHVLRRSPGCHIVRGIKCDLNEDGSRVRASEVSVPRSGGLSRWTCGVEIPVN